MSRHLLRAQVVVASDGSVLLNVATLDAPLRLDALVRTAKEQRGAVFVGVQLDRRERARLLREIELLLPNATLPIIANRLQRERL